ncbi:MAG: hypothetical protein CVT66_10715 [Actinobacteria bacterium HGW-Actinobacteria-6]|nr:MAG: hypothetical protein CVT66_10715 [Actinobacteria bacterium HGW-Actinobacteria-6]
MLSVLAGLIVFLVLALIASLSDPIGWGYLLSSRVDTVAEARHAESLLGMPILYFIAALSAGAGVIISMDGASVLSRAVLGIAVATFLLGTMWDMRRRRGTLAVYIELRREELSFHPTGDVIEIPKLMFVTLNQPGPVVWLLAAAAIVVRAITEFPHEGWYGILPLVALAAAAVYAWIRQRESVWEPLARRLRRASFLDGDQLLEHLEESLDFDPEVMLVRREADAMVARIISGV